MKLNFMPGFLPLVVAAICLLFVSRVDAVVNIGEPAPELQLVYLDSGEHYIFDTSTTKTLLLVFLKPQDRYLEESLDVLTRSINSEKIFEGKVQRIAILSRTANSAEISNRLARFREDWHILLDEDDHSYTNFGIIATPTTVIIDGNGIVRVSHPGYDRGLAQDVRVSLAEILDVNLPAAATTDQIQTNLLLQLARRMAHLEMWENSIQYYQKSNEKTPLTNDQLVELAEVYFNSGDKAETLAIVEKLTDSGFTSDGLDALQRKINQPEPKRYPPAIRY